MRNILAKTSCTFCVLISSSLCSADTRQIIPTSDHELVNAERSVMESLVLDAQPIPVTKKEVLEKKSVKVVKTVKKETGPLGDSQAGAQPQPAKEEVKKIDTVKSIKSVPVNVEVKNGTMLNSYETQIAQLKSENEMLKTELEKTREKVSSLNQEVDAARSELVVAETEMNRLLALTPLKASTKRSIVPEVREVRNDQRAMVIPSSSAKQQMQVTESAMPERGAPYPVATVSASSAELRLGPGASFAILTRLPEGARVAVEMRKGEWYRVFSPAGERAWIHSGAVIFGDKVSPMNDSSSARVKGYQSSAEDRAFREFAGR